VKESYQPRVTRSTIILEIKLSRASTSFPERSLETGRLAVLDPVMVPVRDPEIVPVREPVMVPVRDPVIVPTREFVALVREPVIVPPWEAAAMQRVNIVAANVF